MKIKETPLKEQRRLEKEVNKIHKRLGELIDGAAAERILEGLVLAAKYKSVLGVKHFHNSTLSGELDTNDHSYEVTEACGAKGYHGSAMAYIGGLRVTVWQDDGHTSLQLSIDTEADKPLLDLVESHKRFKAFLDKVGIGVSAKYILQERDNLVKKVVQLNANIALLTIDP